MTAVLSNHADQCRLSAQGLGCDTLASQIVAPPAAWSLRSSHVLVVDPHFNCRAAQVVEDCVDNAADQTGVGEYPLGWQVNDECAAALRETRRLDLDMGGRQHCAAPS